MLKQIVVSFVLVGMGFLIGAWYVSVDFERAAIVGLAARVLQQDTVLTSLEVNDIEAAKRSQTEFMRSSLIELKSIGASWPDEVERVVEKRHSLVTR